MTKYTKFVIKYYTIPVIFVLVVMGLLWLLARATTVKEGTVIPQELELKSFPDEISHKDIEVMGELFAAILKYSGDEITTARKIFSEKDTEEMFLRICFNSDHWPEAEANARLAGAQKPKEALEYIVRDFIR